jgi:hypothetical protein
MKPTADDDGSPNDRDDRGGGRGHEKTSDDQGGKKLQPIVTPKGGHAHINLQNHSATVVLRGNHNQVRGKNGNVNVSGARTNHDTVALGNGNDDIALSGNHNKITLGNGNDHVALGAHSKHDTVKVGQGHDLITTVAGDDHNTFKLDASTTLLVLHGSHNAVFINGGNDAIVDTAGSSDHLTLHVGARGGGIGIANFSAAHGLVDLPPALGFASAADAAAFANSHSDGIGGSLLTFAGGRGAIDFVGVAPGSFHASNFHIG